MKEDYKNCKLNNIYFNETENGVTCTVDQTGVCATYPLTEAVFEPKAKVLLMDLDGTTVKSEEFWIYLIQKTIRTISKNPDFTFSEEDIPHVSGFSTVEHLTYAINKYNILCDAATANAAYHAIAERELNEILEGRGNVSAFRPREGLKDFLLSVKAEGIKIGLVTSGLDYKAAPEIVSVFRLLGMGDPTEFYDAIITGGKRKIKGQYGTLGELSSKPHPWIYSEIGIMLGGNDKSRIVALEDSSSGVLAARLAGYATIGLSDGNILKSNMQSFCLETADSLSRVEKIITGSRDGFEPH